MGNAVRRNALNSHNLSLLRAISNPNAASPSGDSFGQSIALSGNKCIIGAPNNEESGTRSGRAYIFDIVTGSCLHTLIDPSVYSIASDDDFGTSVAIDGNYCAVGAPGESTYYTFDSGAVYIFDVTTGNLLRTITPASPVPYSKFGYSVAISGNYLLVGEYARNDSSGRVYIYDISTGSLLHTIDNPNVGKVDRFGEVIAAAGNYAVFGIYRESADAEGSVYVFDIPTGTLLYTLTNPNSHGSLGGDHFGLCVSVYKNYCAVGANQESTPAGSGSGVVYIFDLSTGSLVHTLSNPNAYGTVDGDHFGSSISLSNDYCVVGVGGEDIDGATSSGNVYVFDAKTWNLLYTIDNPNIYGTAYEDFFGTRVVIDGGYFVASAPYEDSSGGSSTSVVYVFSIPVNGWKRLRSLKHDTVRTHKIKCKNASGYISVPT